MKRPIHITAVRNDEPDLDRFIAALAAVVMARLDAEDGSENDSPVPEIDEGADE